MINPSHLFFSFVATSLITGCDSSKIKTKQDDENTRQVDYSKDHVVEFRPSVAMTEQGERCRLYTGLAYITEALSEQELGSLNAQMFDINGSTLTAVASLDRNGTVIDAYTPSLGNWGVADPTPLPDDFTTQLLDDAQDRLTADDLTTDDLPLGFNEESVDISGNLLDGGTWHGQLGLNAADCVGTWAIYPLDAFFATNLSGPLNYTFTPATAQNNNGEACLTFYGEATEFTDLDNYSKVSMVFTDTDGNVFNTLTSDVVRLALSFWNGPSVINEEENNAPLLENTAPEVNVTLKGTLSHGGDWEGFDGCFGVWESAQD